MAKKVYINKHCSVKNKKTKSMSSPLEALELLAGWIALLALLNNYG